MLHKPHAKKKTSIHVPSASRNLQHETLIMSTMSNEIKLLTGNSHPLLAQLVANRSVIISFLELFVPCFVVCDCKDANRHGAQCRLGIDIAKTMSLNYSNQETSVTVGESVRDEDVFIIQSTAPGDINDGLMELLIMIHACEFCLHPLPPHSRATLTDKRELPQAAPHPPGASQPSFPTSPTRVRTRRIRAELPSYAPSPSTPDSSRARTKLTRASLSFTERTIDRKHAHDRRLQPRHHHGLARLVRRKTAPLPPRSRLSHESKPLTTVSPSQIQGFFNVPVDNLYAEPSVLRWIQENLSVKDCVIVSPDAGGAKRATSLADRLDLPFALIHKERPRPNEVGRMVLVGNVVDKVCILVDDMADTCGTLAKAAAVVQENGAREVVAIVTHGILSGPAIDNINKSVLTQVVVTNTVPLGDKLERCPKLKVIDVSGTLAESIRRTHNGESVSYLFTHVF